MPQFVIDDHNYAVDKKLAAKATDWLKKVCFEVSTRRRALDIRYMQFYNIYRC